MTLAFSSTGLACRSILLSLSRPHCTWLARVDAFDPPPSNVRIPSSLTSLTTLSVTPSGSKSWPGCCHQTRNCDGWKPTRRTWPNQSAYEWTEGSEVSRGSRRQAVEWNRQPSSNCQRRTEKECLKAKGARAASSKSPPLPLQRKGHLPAHLCRQREVLAVSPLAQGSVSLAAWRHTKMQQLPWESASEQGAPEAVPTVAG